MFKDMRSINAKHFFFLKYSKLEISGIAALTAQWTENWAGPGLNYNHSIGSTEKPLRV